MFGSSARSGRRDCKNMLPRNSWRAWFTVADSLGRAFMLTARPRALSQRSTCAKNARHCWWFRRAQPQRQCKGKGRKGITQEHERPTPLCPHARRHLQLAEHPCEGHQVVNRAPSAAADGGGADSHGDSVAGAEDRRNRRRSTRRPVGRASRHRDVGRSHPVEGFGHVGCCSRCFVPSCSPSCPCGLSSWPSPTSDASRPTACAPADPSSRTVESAPWACTQRCLRIRRIRRSMDSLAGCGSWHIPAACGACLRRACTASRHCAWVSVAAVPAVAAVEAGHLSGEAGSCSQEGACRSSWDLSGYPAWTPSARQGEREGEPEWAVGGDGALRSMQDTRQAAEGTGHFPDQAKPFCLLSRSRR